MLFEIIQIGVAAALITVPHWFSSHAKQKHQKRLAALRNGAPEAYFEERRSLEAYPPRGSWAFRLFGLALMAFAISSLMFRN